MARISTVQINFLQVSNDGSPVTAVTVKLIPPETCTKDQLISMEMTKNGVKPDVSRGCSLKNSPCSSCDGGLDEDEATTAACTTNKCPQCCSYINKSTHADTEAANSAGKILLASYLL